MRRLGIVALAVAASAAALLAPAAAAPSASHGAATQAQDQACPPLIGQSVGPERGDAVACHSRAETVALAGRISRSVVSGQMRDGYTHLEIRARTTKAGPGFPLNRLIAGKGFTISLKGKSIVNQEDFKTHKYAYSTTGSVRAVFTPRTRTSAAARSSARAASPRPDACSKGAPPSTWSAKKRGCFAISAAVSWIWQNSGKPPESPCTGSINMSAKWSGAGLNHLWIGDDFSVRVGPTYQSRDARAQFALSGPLTAEVKLSGEAQGRTPGSCVPWVTTGCGAKIIAKHKAELMTSLAEGNSFTPARFQLKLYDKYQTPYRSCGLPDVPLIPLSVSAPWTVAQILQNKGAGFEPGITVTTLPASVSKGRTYREAIAAAKSVAARRLLATRVGGSKAFTAQEDPGGFGGTGKWKATVTFKRLR